MIVYDYELTKKKIKIEKPVGGRWSVFVEGNMFYKGVPTEREARRLVRLVCTAPEFERYFKK